VRDVAQGHLDALTWLDAEQAKRLAAAPASSAGAAAAAAAAAPGILDVFNFGTGEGTTVLELVHAMERAAGKPLNHVVGPRRAGDLDMAYANPEKSARVLGWRCRRSRRGRGASGPRRTCRAAAAPSAGAGASSTPPRRPPRPP
jgi:UDP-glucose 4-epimerase